MCSEPAVEERAVWSPSGYTNERLLKTQRCNEPTGRSWREKHMHVHKQANTQSERVVTLSLSLQLMRGEAGWKGTMGY